MNMKPSLSAALLLAGCLLTASAAAAEKVYKWVDEQGITHYSQTPPPGVAAEPVAVTAGGGGDDAALDRYREIISPPKAEAPDGKAKEGDIEPAQKAEARARNCKLARERLAVLTSRSRILVLQPDGTSVRLTEEERQAEIERMKTIIAANCEE